MRIVFICTTNVWGSAMAELMARSVLSDWDPNRQLVQVLSAGVRAQVGASMPAVAQQVLAELGVDGSTHRARWMSTEVLADADLTLTIGERQRDAALALNPRGLRSTFVIREAAALLDGLPPLGPATTPAPNRDARVAIAAAASARRYRRAPLGADDLPDLTANDLPAARILAGKLSQDILTVLRALGLPGDAGRTGHCQPAAWTAPGPLPIAVA